MTKTHVHMIGGAGRIGTSLAQSLVADPVENMGSLSIYCDVTKAAGLQASLGYKETLPLRVEPYSRFTLQSVIDKGWSRATDRHIVLLHRGVNDKRYWLNQPLEAMNIQLQACRLLMASDLELHPDVHIIHFTSQLCDLIEGGASLDEVCGGLESYRRPYMISRLHQEALLTSYAYQHSIPTTFIRLASVYGFHDDPSSPWVLNTLITQWKKSRTLDLRNPTAILSLIHRNPLLSFLRKVLEVFSHCSPDSTVSQIRPPVLRMSVQQLASVIESDTGPSLLNSHQTEPMLIPGDFADNLDTADEHRRLLLSVVSDLMTHASR